MIVVVSPDLSARYLSKIFSDVWMRENRLFETSLARAGIEDRLRGKPMPLVIAARRDRKADVIQCMKEHGISQLPVVHDGCCTGFVTEGELSPHLFPQEHQEGETIEDVIDPDGAAALGVDTLLNELIGIFGQQKVAVVVADNRLVAILTTIDFIDYLAVLNPKGGHYHPPPVAAP